ncbi:MAG: sulfatase [Anaerolineales bacterium]|nr:sulfatase [Anaerolineales bacterium]MCB8951522.1 sulfatase [Ardenticatenales bacterium]
MSEKFNVMLIVIDALRADHLGCYGYSHATSPTLDALAADGVLGENLFAPAIPTQPSFTTLYTGQHPLTHGVIAHGGEAMLAPTAPSLAEHFLHGGYHTCAVDNLWRARPWFGRGFVDYLDPSLKHTLPVAVTCEEMNDSIIKWLRVFGADPFFMLIHYWDPHYPLLPPPQYRGRFYDGRNPTDRGNHSLDRWWQHPVGLLARNTWLRTPAGRITDADYVRALYDQEIRYVDDGVSSLMQALEEMGLSQRTLVLIMADHGASMTEHDIFFEHYGLYDATTHVPLIVRWPGHLPAGRRLPHLLRANDVAPTLLEAVGLPAARGMEGTSFWPLLTGESDEGGHDWVISLECSWQASWSLRTREHKLILNRELDPCRHFWPSRELYNLQKDPLETHDLAQTETHLADDMTAQLEAWIAAGAAAAGLPGDPVAAQGITLGRRG